MNRKGIIYAILLALTLTLLPKVTANWPDSNVLNPIKFTLAFLMAPGTIFAMIVSSGNVHGINSLIVDTTDVIFYFVTFYFLMARARRA